MPSKAAVWETLRPSYVPQNEHSDYMAFETKMCILGNILPPAIGTPKEAQNDEVPMSELLDIAANLPLPHTSISPRAGIADSINTDSFKEGENDATTAHQSATTAAPTPMPIPSTAPTASGSLPALIGTHYNASPQRVSVAANGNRGEDSEISQATETAVSNKSKADTDIIQWSTFPSDDELGSTESDRSHDYEKETLEDNEYSDNEEYEHEHTVNMLHPKYYGSHIRIRTAQEGIGNSSHGPRTAYRDQATDSIGARLGSTDSAAPGNPWAKYQHRLGKRKCCSRGRQPWWSS